MKSSAFLLLALVLASPVAAQQWSVGVGTGPFVFGDFVERTIAIGTPGGATSSMTLSLSGATRPGLVVDLERSLGDRWAVRAEGTFARSPMALKNGDGEGNFELDAGDLDVVTIALPVVFRINRGGALRFHVAAGPANAIYRMETDGPSQQTAFEGSRSRWGFTAGVGAAWHWSERFAVEGSISDIVTASPFRRSDFVDSPGLDIRRPHNVHSSVGIRYRF